MNISFWKNVLRLILSIFFFALDIEEVIELRTDLKAVDDIANRVKIDATSIRAKLVNFENQSESERSQTVGKLRENLALLVDDMAKELTKMAIKLNPIKASIETQSSTQKTVERKSKSRFSDSTDIQDSDKSESRRKSRKLKRRRKVPKSLAELSDSSMDLSSNSEDMVNKGTAIIKDEPFIISQNIDDLMNGNASNSANESIRKENDFLGFDNDDDDNDFEIGLKTELNDTNSSQLLTIQKPVSQNSNSSKDKDADSDESTEIIDHHDKQFKATKEKEKTTENSAIESMEVDADRSSSVASLSDNNDLIDENDDDDDDSDDDEDIRKYVKIKQGYLIDIS